MQKRLGTAATEPSATNLISRRQGDAFLLASSDRAQGGAAHEAVGGAGRTGLHDDWERRAADIALNRIRSRDPDDERGLLGDVRTNVGEGVDLILRRYKVSSAHRVLDYLSRGVGELLGAC